jgi:Fe-S oxidoreductase
LYAIPEKDTKVAVVGAGLSGLSCAFRLAVKGYGVTVFEKNAFMGGIVRGMVPEGLLDREIAEVAPATGIEYIVNTEVEDINGLIGVFDAVYVATGEGGSDFGLSGEHDERTLATVRQGVFLGGGVCGAEPVQGIAHGLRAAASVEEYLNTGKNTGLGEVFRKREAHKGFESLDIDFTESSGDAIAGSYQEEAGRCPMCNCSKCIDACELMRYYRTNPKRIADDLGVTVLPIKSKIKRVASRMLNSCNLCWCCSAVCPVGIDTCLAMYRSRRILGETGHIAPVYHDFWLEDLRFTLSDEAYAVIAPPDGRSEELFFPGCQLSASLPYAVKGTFDYIKSASPDAALLLSCCGAPAEWAQDDDLLDDSVARCRSVWETLGRPRILFACSTCKKVVAKHIPEAETMLVYEWMADRGISHPSSTTPPWKQARVFDPCASANDVRGQAAVRTLAARAGVEAVNTDLGGIEPSCCGFGGHIYPANPKLAEKVVQSRITESEEPYITYCANCRDLFLSAGKDCRHVLDLYFGEPGIPELPSLTQRRENRRTLKAALTGNTCGGGDVESGRNLRGEAGIDLGIGQELEHKMDRLLLLRNDAENAVAWCEQSGRKFVDPVSGYLTGYRRNREVTVWVEYEVTGCMQAVLHNIYTHRMEISE